jgi:hypothetical protein
MISWVTLNNSAQLPVASREQLIYPEHVENVSKPNEPKLEYNEDKDNNPVVHSSFEENISTPITMNNNTSLKHLEDYKNYLRVTTSLIINFLQDKKYTDEINQIYALSYPASIKSIIIMFDEYNSNYLLNSNEIYEKIFPKDLPIVEKFVKVKKINAKINDQKHLRTMIIDNLENFTKYIYSEDLLKIFIGRVGQ